MYLTIYIYFIVLEGGYILHLARLNFRAEAVVHKCSLMCYNFPLKCSVSVL